MVPINIDPRMVKGAITENALQSMNSVKPWFKKYLRRNRLDIPVVMTRASEVPLATFPSSSSIYKSIGIRKGPPPMPKMLLEAPMAKDSKAPNTRLCTFILFTSSNS